MLRNLPNKIESRFQALIDVINNINTKHNGMKIISVLEAGSASGAIAKHIANRFGKVFVDAVDLPEVIRKIKKDNKKVHFFMKDLNKEFPLCKYDIIYATEVIEHLYNDWFFIENCFKQLKEDGYLIITAPMLESMFGQKDSLHIRIYPKDMLENLLELAGFKIERSWIEDGRKRIIAKKD